MSGERDLPAFEVVDQATGNRFQIWADGRISGFGSANLIINRIPALTRRAWREGNAAEGVLA